MGLKNSGDLEEKIELGSSFKVDKRIFYPVIKISHYKNSFFETKLITPLALIIKEDNKKYLIPLVEEEVSEDFLELVNP